VIHSENMTRFERSNPEKEFSCKPLERFDVDCNTCQCDNTGLSASCPGEFCDPNDKSRRMQPPKDCKLGDEWNTGCNSCFCNGNNFNVINF
jgi:hypothetical protein